MDSLLWLLKIYSTRLAETTHTRAKMPRVILLHDKTSQVGVFLSESLYITSWRAQRFFRMLLDVKAITTAKNSG